MTTTELLVQLRAQLAACADPEFGKSAMRFFREPVDLYGVPTPQVRSISQAAWREVKLWPRAQRNSLCHALWSSGKLEEGGLAIEVYRRFGKQCGSAEFRLFERWLDRFVKNWGHCDGVSCCLLAASIQNEPELIAFLPSWTKSPNRWKRRAAAVTLVREARQGRNTAAIFQIAGLLMEDRDGMVQKGVGWLLKETYPAMPRQTLSFLKPWLGRAPRLVLRLAAEKMTPQHRAAMLGR